ncbi:hypothetical protein LLG95_05065 [bacterium]|nr:hypothetical protein [bacterium]
MSLLNIVNRRVGPPRGRGGNAMILGIVIAVIFLVVALGILAKNEAEARKKMLLQSQTDPKVMTARFFLELHKDYSVKDGWEDLIPFMSSEDMAWLEENRRLLAKFSPQADPASDEREERFNALHVMLRFGKSLVHPTITKVHTHGDKGVVFVHEPGDVASMRALFIVNEGGYWKFRRFLGRRDEFEIMKYLADAHESAGVPPTGDETAFKADPTGYAFKKRNELLVEAGLPPVPSPSPTATPAESAKP